MQFSKFLLFATTLSSWSLTVQSRALPLPAAGDLSAADSEAASFLKRTIKGPGVDSPAHAGEVQSPHTLAKRDPDPSPGTGSAISRATQSTRNFLRHPRTSVRRARQKQKTSKQQKQQARENPTMKALAEAEKKDGRPGIVRFIRAQMELERIPLWGMKRAIKLLWNKDKRSRSPKSMDYDEADMEHTSVGEVGDETWHALVSHFPHWNEETPVSVKTVRVWPRKGWKGISRSDRTRPGAGKVIFKSINNVQTGEIALAKPATKSSYTKLFRKMDADEMIDYSNEQAFGRDGKGRIVTVDYLPMDGAIGKLANERRTGLTTGRWWNKNRKTNAVPAGKPVRIERFDGRKGSKAFVRMQREPGFKAIQKAFLRDQAKYGIKVLGGMTIHSDGVTIDIDRFERLERFLQAPTLRGLVDSLGDVTGATRQANMMRNGLRKGA